MNKNRVARHEIPDELAQDNEVQKRVRVVTCKRGEGQRKDTAPYPGRSDHRAEVSRSRSSRWGNDHPGRIAKANYRAKGRTDKELNRKAQDNLSNRHLGGKKPERTRREGRRPEVSAAGARGYRGKWRKKWFNTKQ